MKRLATIGLLVLSSLILISCTSKDTQAEAELEEPTPAITQTLEAEVAFTATKTPTPIPTETPLPTATSTPEPQPEVELIEVTSYFDIGGDFFVIGLIENTGEVPTDMIWATVNIRDTSDMVVATRETFTSFGVAHPGEIFPFQVYFFDADFPEEYSVEVELEPEVAWDSSLDSNYRDFEMISAEGQVVSNGKYYELLGELRNSGDRVSESNSVHLLLFNSEDALIGYTTTFTKFAVLQPGSTSPFEFFISTENMVEFEIDRFEIIVVGHASGPPVVVEPTPDTEESFKLVDVNGYPLLGHFHIVGLLQNTSPYDLQLVTVFINLRNSNGKLIASDSGLTLLLDMPANEILPFEIQFIDPPTEEIGSIEVAAQGQLASTTRKITRDFEIVNASGEPTEFGGYTIKGEILNLAGMDVEQVRIAAALFNPEGKILGATLGALDQEVFAADEVSGFEISFTGYAEGEVDRFEFYVLGYEVEEE
jgi:hypothetical protein